MLHYPSLQRMVLIMDGIIEGKVIDKGEELFLCLYINSLSVPHHQALFFFSPWWQLWFLHLSCLSNVAFSLWFSALEKQRIIWWLYAPLTHQYSCLQNSILLLLFTPSVMFSLPPFLLFLFNWVCICTINIFICCICCTSWGNICVECLV